MLKTYTNPVFDQYLADSRVLKHEGDQEIIVYHTWDPGMTARRLCIELLQGENGMPMIHGPTWTP